MPSTASASMLHRLSRAALAALCLSAPAQAAELRISFGEESLRAEYLAPLSQPVADSAPTLQAGALYRENDETDGSLLHAGVVIYGDAGSKSAIVQAGIGGRLYGLSTDPDLNGGALAMGGSVLGRIPNYDRFGAFVDLWFAPQVSSFGELDRVLEINLGVEYQLLRQAALGLGWRRIEFKAAGISGTQEFEDSAFLAFKFLF